MIHRGRGNVNITTSCKRFEHKKTNKLREHPQRAMFGIRTHLFGIRPKKPILGKTNYYWSGTNHKKLTSFLKISIAGSLSRGPANAMSLFLNR